LPFLLALFALGGRFGQSARYNVIERIREHLCGNDAMRVHWPLLVINNALLQLEHVVDGVAGDLAEQRVLVLQLRRGCKCEEELRGVVILSRIGHSNEATSRVAQAGVELVLKGLPVDGLAASAIAIWISALDNEALNQPVKLGVLVVSLQAELDEVPACFRTLSRPQLDVYVAHSGLQKDFSRCGRLLDVNIAHFCQKLRANQLNFV